MPNPNAPYFVHFSADPASSATIDHSQSAPGGGVHRAGHTSIDFPGKGGLTWQPETGAPRADGLVPFYFRSVNVYFRLADYVVRITSDYAAGSCSFNATMRHEVNEHIVNPTRITVRLPRSGRGCAERRPPADRECAPMASPEPGGRRGKPDTSGRSAE